MSLPYSGTVAFFFGLYKRRAGSGAGNRIRFKCWFLAVMLMLLNLFPVGSFFWV